MPVSGAGETTRVGPDSLRAYDFSEARGILIPSVPSKAGGHMDNKYGHMRLRRVLCTRSFPHRFAGSDVLLQACPPAHPHSDLCACPARPHIF